MGNVIYVHDLPEEDIKFVEKLVNLLRKKQTQKKGKENIRFATWPLGVKGHLTRKEIYDHL